MAARSSPVLRQRLSAATTDQTVDSEVIGRRAAGTDVFVNTAIPKFATQAIRKAAEIEWKPPHILASVGSSVALTLRPAGLENAKDTVSDFLSERSDRSAVERRSGLQDWLVFMDKYYPEGDKTHGAKWRLFGPLITDKVAG